MSDHVIVEADGGSRGNPGPAGYGAVVFDAAARTVLAERRESIGTATNNVAEYGGLIAGLQAARELGARRVDVRMDSKLVVEQMSGRWSVKNAALQGLSREAQALRRDFDEVTFAWIPREKNKHADRLANEAMDAAAGIAPKPARTASAPPPQWVPPTGPPTRLALVRHGSTVHSADKRLSGRNDLPLDDNGQRQARALAGRSWADVVAVVSSPLPRAVETAEAIAGPLGLPVRTVDGLMEVDFGQWEGRTVAEVRETDPAAFDAWRASPDTAPPGGESFAAVTRRVRRARDEILAAHRGPGTVVAVSHVTPIKTLVRLALDAPPSALFRLHLDTASVSAIDYWDDGSSSVRLVNDTGHLA